MTQKQEKILAVCKDITESNWGYIYGTSGQIWTASAYNDLISRHDGQTNYLMSIKYGKQWIGHRVADCSGLTLYVYKHALGVIPAHGSNTQYKQCILTGNVQDGGYIPAGCLVFKTRNNVDRYHVGIYLGSSQVLEARGASSGVVISKLGAWNEWGMLQDLGESEGDTSQAGAYKVVSGNGKSVNVRKAATKKSSILDVLPVGTEVTVISSDGAWSQISYQKTIDGYMMDEFLTKI